MVDSIQASKVAIIEVTPEMAYKWLDGNIPDNRKIDSHWVDYLAGEMTAGRWQVTNQGIGFSSEGQLLDGQHRLMAVIRAQQPIKMIVMEGMNPESFMALDSNKARDMAVRTKIPPFYNQVYSFLIRLATNQKASPEDVKLLHQRFLPVMSMVYDACYPMVKFYTSTPVRSAALIAIETGVDSDFVLKSYYILADNKAAATSSQKAFIRMHEDELEKHKSCSSMETFYRAFFVFYSENAEVSQIHLNPTARNIFIEKTKGMINFTLHNHI